MPSGPSEIAYIPCAIDDPRRRIDLCQRCHDAIHRHTLTFDRWRDGLHFDLDGVEEAEGSPDLDMLCNSEGECVWRRHYGPDDCDEMVGEELHQLDLNATAVAELIPYIQDETIISLYEAMGDIGNRTTWKVRCVARQEAFHRCFLWREDGTPGGVTDRVEAVSRTFGCGPSVIYDDLAIEAPLLEFMAEQKTKATYKREAKRARFAERKDEAEDSAQAKSATPSVARDAYAIPLGPFATIVIDPPWRYESRQEDMTHRGRLPYESMSIADIKALELPSDKDCVLWLWTTNAFMHEAFHVLETWAFQPKTILTWVKDRMGVGDWLRGQTEHCIMATRGRPLVNLTNQTTLLQADVRQHSRKPDEFFALVENLCHGPYLEMFARQRREGWQSHGLEVDKFAADA